jgi:hypothetical protein
VTGNGETIHALLQRKLDEKEKQIRQLMDTLHHMTANLSTFNNIVKELAQMKKQNEELKKVNVNLELENGLLRSNMESTNDLQMNSAAGAVGGEVRPPGWSDQGSIVTAPEEEENSIDSFELMPHEPMNFQTTKTEDNPEHADELEYSLLQEQLKEHEEAFRKERNDRVMLNQTCKTLKRDVRVLSMERNQARHRAEVAEEDAKRANEEALRLKETIEQMKNVQNIRSAPSSHTPSTVSSPRREPDTNPTRDPLTCVWPPNDYQLLMPPNYSRTQRGRRAQTGGSTPADFEIVPQGEGEETANPPEGQRRYLEWDMGGALTKKENENVNMSCSLENDEIDRIKRAIKKFDDASRWPCQACTYRNRDTRSVCDYCGTVDAAQRRRHNICI